MNTSTPTLTADQTNILHEGWQILVNQLGLLKATQFVVLLERGEGDTIEDIITYWDDTSIEAMHQRILEWKASSKPT